MCRVELASDLSASRNPADGGKEEHDRVHQGHAEELAAIQFLDAAVALPTRTYFVRNETYSTLQLEPGDHSRLDHPGTGMRATSPEVSRCYIQVFQAADSGRLQCARDQ
jgi:hypothetical protein